MSKLIRRSALATDEHAGGNVSEYREYRPPLPLAEHFLCFWTQTVSSQAEFPQLVLPDCCVDIILINETAVVVGPWTEFFVAHLPPGTNIIGARCYPGHVPNVLGIPASELLNQSVPLRRRMGPRRDCSVCAYRTGIHSFVKNVGDGDSVNWAHGGCW